MVDYNTHGGYFAPQGLMKINEGGSHEENPNGGVQLGVDGQGIPNLVEEDEMVYKDFVYSDNIKADGGFLEKNNLPTKYAGKFYSEIAEALCDEIGEQTDPISLNGLNASLGRLAGAQEEQKAAEEEAELMKALQQMSPEDLAMLEQALMQQQAPEQPMMPEEQMQPEMMPEEVVPEQMAPAVPMMANGGFINTFEGGGRAGSKGQKALNLLRSVGEFISPVETKEITMPDGNTVHLQYGIGNAAAPANVAADIARGKSMLQAAAKQSDRIVRNAMRREGKDLIKFATKMNKSAAKEALKGAASAVEEVSQAAPVITETTSTVTKTPFLRRKGFVPFLAKTGIGTGVLTALGAGARFVANTWGNPDAEDASGDYVYDPNDFAFGGFANKFAGGSWMNQPWSYPHSRTTWEPNADWSTGRYLPADYDAPYGIVPAPAVGDNSSESIDPYYPYIQLPGSAYDVWGQGRFLPDDYASYFGRIHAPAEGWFRNYNDEPVAPVDYPQPIANLGELDGVTVVGRRSPRASSPVRGQVTPATTRREPGDTIARLDPIENKARNSGIVEGLLQRMDDSNLRGPGIVSDAGSGLNGYSDWAGTRFTGPEDASNNNTGSPAGNNGFDWRYLSPAIDAAMGIGALATPADHYDYNPIRPYLPYGRIRQQYERYNPLDMNLATNRMRAQANATMAALRNAGMGPSTGAQMIGADYIAGQNLGNALAGVWDANNQRYNQVVNQHNAADAAKAQFDWGVDSARANALNQFAPYNQRMALQTQMLNNQAEQQKYDTIGSYIDSAKQFFANKGREDLARNMVNTNRAFLGYGVDNMNNVVYDKNGNPVMLVACGGKINKKK